MCPTVDLCGIIHVGKSGLWLGWNCAWLGTSETKHERCEGKTGNKGMIKCFHFYEKAVRVTGVFYHNK